MVDPNPKRNPRVRIGTLGLALAGAAVAVAVPYGFERIGLMARERGTSVRRAAPDPFVQVSVPGVTRPPTASAERASLRGDEEVIGVVVGGRARAYRLGALEVRTNHVVNDLIGGTPISVTYCDISRCLRVYTEPTMNTPLDIEVGGLHVVDGGEMVLKVAGKYYFQRSGLALGVGPGSGLLPYGLIEPARTTWREWVRRHPETDVFEGRSSAETPGTGGTTAP